MASTIVNEITLDLTQNGDIYKMIYNLKQETPDVNKYYRLGWGTGESVFVQIVKDPDGDASKDYLVLDTTNVGDNLGIRKARTRWYPTIQDLSASDWYKFT